MMIHMFIVSKSRNKIIPLVLELLVSSLKDLLHIVGLCIMGIPKSLLIEELDSSS